MQQLFFWRRWPVQESALYSIFLILIALLIVTSFVFYFLGPEFMIGWETYAQAESISYIISEINSGFFGLSIDLDQDIISQFFTGGDVEVPSYSYYGFLMLMALGVITLSTAITYLKRFWYFVGVSLMIGGFTTLDTDLLYLFGEGNKTGLAILLALFIPATYIFNKVRTNTSLFLRWMYFLSASLVFAGLMHFFAETTQPFLTLASSSIYLAMALSALFLLMIAHEILIAMLTLLSSGQSRVLRDFLIFCAVYLLLLLFTYLHETSIISWDMVYVNVLLLISVSGILGIWGFRKREEQYNYLMDFAPGGAFFYVGMMLIALATFSHLEISFNDPGIEVFRDFTIMGHLAFGVIFLVYLLANFATPLGNNMAVHKVMFNPANMPYFTFRLAGIIMFVGLLFPSGTKTSLYQTQSAYFNALGDLAIVEKEPLFALRYYEESASYGYNNHKANYSLGKFHIATQAFDLAISPMRRATEKWPTPQSFVDLSRAYMATNQPYEALFTLKKGQTAFPSNYEIANNLGLAYNDVNVLDSAFLALDGAHALAPERTNAGSNILGMFAKHQIPYDPDSLLDLYVNRENDLSVINGYAMKNQAGEAWDYPIVSYDSSLTYMEASLIYSQTLNALFKTDTFQTRSVSKYISHPANSRFRDKVEMASIMNSYRNQQVGGAFRKLNNLANWSNENGHNIYNIGGKWALEQNAPGVAIQFFDWSIGRNPLGSKLDLAMATSEARRTEDAKVLWTELLNSENEQESTTAKLMLSVYDLTENELITQSDAIINAYLRFVIDPLDTTSFLRTWNQMRDGDNKVLSMIEECRDLVETGRVQAAVNLIQRIEGIRVSSNELVEKIKWMELELVAAQKNIGLLANRINDGTTFDISHEVHKQYFTGLIKAAGGDSTAIEHFKYTGRANPFYEDAVISSANYLSPYDTFEAYDILVTALEINPNSVPLLKAYILQCARVQLDNYAEISLDNLRTLIPSAEFNAFYSQYVQLAREVESEETEI